MLRPALVAMLVLNGPGAALPAALLLLGALCLSRAWGLHIAARTGS